MVALIADQSGRISATTNAITDNTPFRTNKTKSGLRTASIASRPLALIENRRH